MISNDAILSPSSLKKNRRSTGLPGKFPTRWLVTTVFPSFSSHARASLVYSYLAEASVFHCLRKDNVSPLLEKFVADVRQLPEVVAFAKC